MTDGPEIRARELGVLLAAARPVNERGYRSVLVNREAGIGKTHLARTAADRLREDGVTVAWGRADPVERSVPYAAIAQVLAALPGRHELLHRGAERPGDAVRHEVSLPVARALEEACATGPLAVVVDDLHHADEDTLVLLGFLVRRMVDHPISWIMTVRPHLADPSPALNARLHGLREDSRLDELPLGALDHASVAQLADATVGHPLDDDARDVVVRRASGNPFFAIQVALSLAEAGTVDDGSARAVGSVSRRAALLERVVPLGADARAVGRAVAVFGDIDLDQLDVLADHLDEDRDRVEDGFDRLVRADLLRARGDRFEFTHDLIRETLYEDLPPVTRMELHLQAGRVSERVYRDDLGPHLAAIAHHFAQAAPLGDVGPAIDYSLRAAGRAIDVFAYEDAAALLERAL
ncbi:MAG: AAA family ATPase, partial [Ilumatobacteraceae bacterium]